MFIEKNGTWTIVLADSEKYKHFHDTRHLSNDYSGFVMDYFAYKVEFIGANFSNKIKIDSSSFYYNYYLGNESSQHRAQVYSYKSIHYKNIWPNIDLILYTTEDHQFKYDFILNKGAKVEDIQMKYIGPECLTLEDNQLIINGSFSLLKEQLPITYFKRTDKELSCAYKLSNNTISFNLDVKQVDETIIIDPILVGATASGSTGSNFGHTAGYDIDGNIYTGAICFATGYPTDIGSYQQTFPSITCSAINKLNPDGSNLIFSTYLGGNNGIDYPVSLACTESKKLVVLGASGSDDFPTTATAFQQNHGGLNDITISIFSEDGGSLLGSSYLGGSNQDGQIATNSSIINLSAHDNFKGTVNVSNGEVICVGTISSDNIAGLNYSSASSISSTNPDAIVFKMDTTLSTLIANAVIGGSDTERGYGLTTDQNNNVYICGSTLSQDFQTTTGAYQETSLTGINESSGFITKLSPNLNSIIASSYISTSTTSTVFKGVGSYFVSLDNDENPYVYGVDRSLQIPQIGSGYNFGDGIVYIAQFDSNLTTLISTNKLGNTGSVELGAFKVDNCNRILFSCYGNSSFQTTPDNILPTGGMYVGALSSGGQNLTFGTYYTGGHVDGGTSQFGDNGSIYHAVCVNANNFQCHANAYSQNIASHFDCKVFKIDPELETGNIKIDNVWPNMKFCIGSTHLFETVTLGNLSDYSWYYNDQYVSNDIFFETLLDSVGIHTLKVVGESECVHLSEDSISFEVFDINPEFISDTIHCVNGVLQFTDQSNLSTFHQSTISDWLWDFGDGQQSTLQNPTHSYSSAGQYDISLTIFTVDSCESTINKPLHIEIFDLEPSFDFDSIVCDKNEVNFTPLNTIPEHIPLEIDSYLWDFGDGQESTLQNPSHIYSDTGQYNVTLHITLDNGCSYSTTNPSVITVKLLTIDMMLLTDSIWYPFDFPAEAYTLNTGFDSLQWYLDYEPVSNEEQIEFYLGTTDEVQYIDLTLKGWQGNCEATITKQIKLTNYEDFNIPNAFTPNGDGINDVFKPIGRQVENAEYFEFKIHNRWGEQVYFSNDNEAGWNGINKRGKKVSAGVYVWNLELQSKISGRQSYNGWVKLIK